MSSSFADGRETKRYFIHLIRWVELNHVFVINNTLITILV